MNMSNTILLNVERLRSKAIETVLKTDKYPGPFKLRLIEKIAALTVEDIITYSIQSPVSNIIQGILEDIEDEEV